MGRRAFYALASFSCLGMIAMLIIWPLSHFYWFHLEYKAPSHASYTLGSHTGRLLCSYAWSEVSAWPAGLSFNAYRVESPHHWSYLGWIVERSARMNRTEILGVLWLHDPAVRPYYAVDLDIPCAYLAMLFAILPALAVRAFLRHRKASRTGFCTICSYDLRAHRTGDKCPECGTPIPATPPSDLKLEP